MHNYKITESNHLRVSFAKQVMASWTASLFWRSLHIAWPFTSFFHSCMNHFLQSDGLCIKTTRVLHVLPFCWWQVCILEATRNILVLSFLSGLWHLYPAVWPCLLLKDFSLILWPVLRSLYSALFFWRKCYIQGSREGNNKCYVLRQYHYSESSLIIVKLCT